MTKTMRPARRKARSQDDHRAKPRRKQRGESRPTNQPEPLSRRQVAVRALIVPVVLLPVFVWAYWPTLVELVRTWDSEADYSHGFLVVPLAVLFLWIRRDRFPGLSTSWAWLGLLLMLASLGIRAAGEMIFVDAMDGWSIMFWVGGAICLLGGLRVLVWALPSVAFLFFMVPLPFGAERMLSYPLQRIATKLSCFSLQFLGQPAIAEGNVILLGDHHLEVAQACSGLRIFMGIVALAFAYLIATRRTWWERVLLVLSIVPVALIANSTRIVVTGLLFQFVSGEAAHKFTHDVAGYFMIPYAAALFGLTLLYITKLTHEVDQVDVGQLLGRDAVRPSTGNA